MQQRAGLHEHRGPSWLRLESVPCEVPYRITDAPLELGIGSVLREGVDATFIGYGPLLLSEAWRAAEMLLGDGLRVGVVSLPWLNQLSPWWLLRTVAGFRHLFSLDNHYAVGGQGDRIAEVLAGAAGAPLPRLHRFAVDQVPACGSNADVLRVHGLDASSLRQRVLQVLSAPRSLGCAPYGGDVGQALPNSFEADTGL